MENSLLPAKHQEVWKEVKGARGLMNKGSIRRLARRGGATRVSAQIYQSAAAVGLRWLNT